MTIKINLLEKTPMPVSSKEEMTTAIADYLEAMLVKHGILKGERLELPSLSHLADFLDTRQMAIHNAFQILRKRGYDYAIHGLNTPLVFWQIPSPISNNIAED